MELYFGATHTLVIIFLKSKKRSIRIITNSGKYDCCWQLFKQLQILTLPSKYMFSLLVFVAKYRLLFVSNSDIHDKNKCHKGNLHLPTTNLTLLLKGVLFSESRIYKHLPTHIKTLSNDLKHFTSKLKSYFLKHTFYSLEEFYQLTFK
jgi:hypothetical protein